ncbi:hypothetical protein [Pseudonocardia spirodelae]|uniref:Uncharacterized protein n=1 Tax=Pseudonocardia spirodelae TaxID=3133431 RepID=A0ABU8T1N2_9PSEU
MAQRSTMTLQDIADLARVQRHVVSMWRQRPRVRGRTVLFPSAVSSDDGVERFDREEIVAYLEETGRGNNDEVRQDAPALAVPEGADVEDVVTLLCLHTLGGAELEDLTPAELIELAAQVDPEDRFLLREVRAADAEHGLGRYVDELMAASYGPADALARLDAGRLRRQERDRGLTDTAYSLIGAIAIGARMHLAGAVALVPPVADRRLAGALAEAFAGIILPDESRAARRRAMIEGLELVDDADGRVEVSSLVGFAEQEALEAADDLVVSLEPGDVGIVLGSAAALCDPLHGKAARNRTQTLAAGNLAMALRLPRGLWKAAHRQNLAVWVVSGLPDVTRSVCLADLEGATVDLGDLTSDVMAALAGTAHRAYRYARRVEPATVLAGVEVLPRGVRATRIAVAEPAAHLDRIHAATLTTSVPFPGFDITVAPAPGRIVLRQRSLGELHVVKQVKMLRGNRIDPHRSDPSGTVRVLAADGSTDELRFDPFDAAAIYRRATRTEPGDVIFLDGPTPRARVDVVGGSLVATPSRVLRLALGAPIGPRALAAVINETAVAGSEWPTWSVPDLPPAERDVLESALGAAADHQADLNRRLGAVHDLVTGLVHGVAAGAVTLDPVLTESKAG